MAEHPGLNTFVGRVRGELTADDLEWVDSTSDAVETLREHLVEAADRLGALERRLLDLAPAPAVDPPNDAPPEADTSGGDGGDDAGLTAWERVVAWAASVNAALVEVAGRRRLPASFDAAATASVAGEQAAFALSDRTVELGALLQSVRGEQVVDELLAAGILAAPPGTTDSIAFAEHGAWDIELLGSGGHTIGRADVAITSDATEVIDHLASRPGVSIVYTTSDAADGLSGTEGITVARPGDPWPVDAEGVVVVDIGSDTSALHAQLADVLDATGAESSADALLEAVPVLALLLVGGRATTRAATTAEPGTDIATSTWQQAKDVVTTAGVSQLVGWASGMNLIKVPATLTFALGRAAVRDARSSVELSGRRVARARRLIAGVGEIGQPH
ncbi:MAG: hypothetical protein U5K29_12560 [Acidimicrobiales bacterium]|nr:hypothetical protein [Acidimicrobiales bacterium]